MIIKKKIKGKKPKKYNIVDKSSDSTSTGVSVKRCYCIEVETDNLDVSIRAAKCGCGGPTGKGGRSKKIMNPSLNGIVECERRIITFSVYH